jgi:hypothetical protein
MNDRRQSEIESAARKVFEQSVGELDGATRSKLTQARHRAMAELEQPPALFGWLPQAALATLAAAAVGVWVFSGSGSGSDGELTETAVVADIEILLSDDELEFYEELDFYAWLESQPEFNGLEDPLDGAG